MDITSGPVVEIDLAGAKIAIPSNTIADLWLSKLRSGEGIAAAAPLFPPRIGSALEGGTYMGVVRGEGGESDHHLIDLGEAPERMNWEAAKKWAADKGGMLPTRREQSVMFGNRGEGQFKAEWYWSCEQCAGDSDYAWMQDFLNGSQFSNRESNYCRARAVRRLTIQ